MAYSGNSNSDSGYSLRTNRIRATVAQKKIHIQLWNLSLSSDQFIVCFPHLTLVHLWQAEVSLILSSTPKDLSCIPANFFRMDDSKFGP